MLLFLCNVVEAQAADLSGPETAEPSNSRVSIGDVSGGENPRVNGACYAGSDGLVGQVPQRLCAG